MGPDTNKTGWLQDRLVSFYMFAGHGPAGLFIHYRQPTCTSAAFRRGAFCMLIDAAVCRTHAMERRGRNIERTAYLHVRHLQNRAAFFHRHLQLDTGPFLRPRTMPSARRTATASFVRVGIILRSVSATKPKAKHNIPVLILNVLLS